jgi:translation initiation factor 5A
MTGSDIFTDKKIQEIYGTSTTVKSPTVKKVELEVVDIADDDYVSMVLPDATLKENIKLPNDKRKELRSAYEAKQDEQIFFTIISVGDDERIIAHRLSKY